MPGLWPNSSEWVVFDRKREDITRVEAHDWKEAASRALERGVIPRRYIDVKDRTGDFSTVPKDEFREFMGRND